MRLPTILLALIMAVSVAAAQEPAAGQERQILHRVAPVYPDLARRVGITGSVKLIAVVAPNGSVKSVEAVGGNPVLIPAAQNAVKEWKFAPAAGETRQQVELRFSSH